VTSLRVSDAAWRPSLAGALAGAAAGLLIRDLAVDSFASFWVPTAVLGAFLHPRAQQALRMATLVVAAAWLAVTFTPLAGWLGRPLVRRDPPRAADAILVLASRLQKDGEPTATALERIVHALELVGEAQAKTVIVTEEHPDRAPSERLVRTMMGRLRLQAEVVRVGPVARTRDEAVLAAALVRERGWRTLIVVTSAIHSRRGCATVEAAGIDVVCSPASDTEFDLETLDRPSDRVVAFREAFYEHVALMLYERKGWLKSPGADARANVQGAR
jgi:uncharacterized SAM-binding protein YcdF (DUF218 family)